MATSRHITWENFRDAFLDPKVPAIHPIPGSPAVSLFVDDGARRLGIRIAQKDIPEALHLPLVEIATSLERCGEDIFLEISTTNDELFEPFFAVMINMADLIQIEGYSPSIAVNSTLGLFRDLLKPKQLLSNEKLIGLWGELWLLRRILKQLGPGYLESWRGPRKEVHDFRFNKTEIEVKTTRNEERLHVISRVSQLEPSPNRVLYILSLQIVSSGAGAGDSLPSMVDSVYQLLRPYDNHLVEFRDLLSAEGYEQDDARYYNEKYVVRSNPVLIKVDNDCPRITSAMINECAGEDASARIDDVRYRVNLTGMGFSVDDQDFLTIVG